MITKARKTSILIILIIFFTNNVPTAFLENIEPISESILMNPALIEQIKSHENVFAMNNNTKVKWFINDFSDTMTTLTCTDHPENETRECTVAILENENFENNNWKGFCKFTMNFTDYENKDTEITTASTERFTLILTTLLKSKKSKDVFADVNYIGNSIDCQNLQNFKHKIDALMWEGSYKLKVSLEGTRNYLTTNVYLKSLRKITPFYYDEIDIFEIKYLDRLHKLYIDQNFDRTNSIYSRNNLYPRLSSKVLILTNDLDLYYFVKSYNYYQVSWRISLTDFQIANPKDIQIYMLHRGRTILVVSTSIKNKVTQLIAFERESAQIKWTKKIHLQSRVKKVQVNHRLGERLDILQNQYHTGKSRIFLETFDEDGVVLEKNRLISKDISNTDCIPLEFYLSETNLIYVCKRHVTFANNKSIDYFLLRATDLENGGEIIFSKNLNYLENSGVLEYHENEYKKLLNISLSNVNEKPQITDNITLPKNISNEIIGAQSSALPTNKNDSSYNNINAQELTENNKANNPTKNIHGEIIDHNFSTLIRNNSNNNYYFYYINKYYNQF